MATAELFRGCMTTLSHLPCDGKGPCGGRSRGHRQVPGTGKVGELLVCRAACPGLQSGVLGPVVRCLGTEVVISSSPQASPPSLGVKWLPLAPTNGSCSLGPPL